MRWLSLTLFLSFVGLGLAAGSATSELANFEHWSASHSHAGSVFSKRAVAVSSYKGPKSGDGTFYGNDGSGGNCLLPARSDLLFAAWPGAAWDNAAHCGACVRVKGPSGSVNVQITNKCPECKPGSLDLSTHAFSKIAPISKGRVPISFTFIPCTSAKPKLESGKTSAVWKSGSSAYWMAIQIRGAAFPIKSVSIRSASGSTYTNLTRMDYNYWAKTSGVGAGPFVVLVRYQNGSKQVLKNVKLNSVIGDA